MSDILFDIANHGSRDWRLFCGTRTPGDAIARMPSPPPWRPRRSAQVAQERQWPRETKDDQELPGPMRERGRTFHSTQHIIEMVNAALYLRRPLLVTGQPGSGKSSLVDAVAWELRLGAPLRWNVTSRSTLREAEYQYDAIGRLQQAEKATRSGRMTKTRLADSIGQYITLGPLGTALLPSRRPRALLIDEIDKADIDLPNDLLNVFEEGEFDIPELRRLGEDTPVVVYTSDRAQPRVTLVGGRIACHEFPLMILTSNGEREFPAPFLRRCLRLQMPNPTGQLEADDNKNWQRLDAVVALHFDENARHEVRDIIDQFKARAAANAVVATDQLLNAIHFVMSSQIPADKPRERVLEELMRELSTPGSTG